MLQPARTTLQSELRTLDELVEVLRQGRLGDERLVSPTARAINTCHDKDALADIFRGLLEPELSDYLIDTAAFCATLARVRLLPLFAAKHAMVAQAFDGRARDQKKAFMDSHVLTEWYWDACGKYRQMRAIPETPDTKLDDADRVFGDGLAMGESHAHRQYGLREDCVRNGYADLNMLVAQARSLGESSSQIVRLHLNWARRRAELDEDARTPDSLFYQAEVSGNVLRIADLHMSNTFVWVRDLSTALESLHGANTGRPVMRPQDASPC